jgi:hypothetical protein
MRAFSAFAVASSAFAASNSSVRGSASARGISGKIMIAVATKTAAVSALITPSSSYTGLQSVIAPNTCVIPQSAMKATKSQASGWNARPRRWRTYAAIANGIAK